MAQGVAGKIKRTGERSHEEIHLITCITLLPGSRRSAFLHRSFHPKTKVKTGSGKMKKILTWVFR